MCLHYMNVLKLHLSVYNATCDKFWPFLGHHLGSHSCKHWILLLVYICNIHMLTSTHHAVWGQSPC